MEKCQRHKIEEECVGQLRQWVNNNSHIPDIPDILLRAFLVCRKYDLDLTKRTIESYVKLSSDSPEMFSNYDPLEKEMMETMSQLYIAVLPETDPEGRVVVVIKLSDKDPSIMSLELLLKYTCISAFLASFQIKCLDGYVIVIDSGPIKFGHILKLRVTPIMKMFRFLQDAIPINIRKVHVINTSYFTSIIMKTLRPFIDKELSEKLVFHRTDLSALFVEIQQSILPEDYGGEIPSMKDLGKENTRNLVVNRDIVMQADIIRFQERK